MKILSAEQIREWDQYSIKHEPVISVDLMEWVAVKCTEWLLQYYPTAISFSIFCGKGNNGGDGLAIARLLMEKQYAVTINILEFGHKGTDDFQTNLERLHQLQNSDIHFIQSEKNFHPFSSGQIIIDALFGSGLNRGIEGVTANLVQHINTSGCDIISIDIPSGLFVDQSSLGNNIIKATHTLSFQCYKQAFMVSENADYTGQIHILDIGLHPDYLKKISPEFELVDEDLIQSIYKPRKAFAHKGNFGHALLVAGSYGKMGAAILAAKACLRSGTGLLTCHIPKCGYDIMQISVPEAMVMVDFNSSINTKIDDEFTKYESIGIGPGIGTASETRTLLFQIFNTYKKPLLLDADALNILSMQNELLSIIPPGSILTPHPKEFERVFGKAGNDFERIRIAIHKAKELNIIIILKGHHTLIATPDGKGFFNSTGNPGMATAGSGDVLSGILTGLLSQGYSSLEASLLGVYIHGMAGDLAAEIISSEAMIAGDIINFIGASFKKISSE